MRILIVGAGAVGGYFGGRLLENGADVTFLVREKRQKQLQEHGLMIESVHGNVSLDPKTIIAGEKADVFDVIVLATKAYHLADAMKSIEPYVGTETMIVPLLNGILHIDRLKEHFGDERVVGGLCFIETTLGDEGKIIQTSGRHDLIFGELFGGKTDRIKQLEAVFDRVKATIRASENITRDMWHKYLFITTMSGMTTLMRAPLGPILESKGGEAFVISLFNETAAIMRRIGAPIANNIEEQQLKTIKEMNYEMKSSMQRDMEKGLLIEADHLQGYLVDIASEHNMIVPHLQTVYTNLKVYEQLQLNLM